MSRDGTDPEICGHEPPAAVNARVVCLAGALLTLAVIGGLAIVQTLRTAFESSVAAPPRASAAGQPDAAVPSTVLTRQDLLELRRREQRRLSGYAWNDEARSTARMPIDRAMRLAVKHHFQWPGDEDDATDGTNATHETAPNVLDAPRAGAAP